MGHPVELPPGNDCGACTPAVFAVGATPRWIQISFDGIEPCPGTPEDDPIPNQSFLAEQDFNCRWVFGTLDYQGYWWARGVDTIFFVQANPPPPTYFFSQGGGGCDQTANNQENCDFGDDYHNGSAQASGHGGPSYLFAYDYNFAPYPALMYEEWDIGGDELMYRIADGTKRVNVLFVYDKTN